MGVRRWRPSVARRQDFAAPLGLHSGAEAVCLVASAHFRLKGTFRERIPPVKQSRPPQAGRHTKLKRIVYATPSRRSRIARAS